MINGRAYSRIDIMLREQCYENTDNEISKTNTCDKIRRDVDDLLWNGFNYYKLIKHH